MTWFESLQVISNAPARHVSIIFGKPEAYPIIFLVVKFKKKM